MTLSDGGDWLIEMLFLQQQINVNPGPSIHSLIFGNHVILARVVVYLYPIPGTLDKLIHPGWGTSPSHGTMHKFMHSCTPRCNLTWPEVNLYRSSYTSSTLKEGTWSYDMLHDLAALIQEHIQGFQNSKVQLPDHLDFSF